MFTGLIAMMGTVKRQSPEGAGRRLTVAAKLFDDSIALGESISVNGVCLTVVRQQSNEVDFQLAPETLQRTNLGELQLGALVNLERALRVCDRLGGHFVQGHVDGLGFLEKREQEGEWERFHFRLPAELTRYVVSKGSIAINGVSLTVVCVSDSSFSVALIPHTLAITNLGSLKPGMSVNLEVDMLGKYVERLLPYHLANVPPSFKHLA